MGTPLIALAVGAVSLAGLLWAEARGWRAARALSKMSCSAGFLALALTGDLASGFDRRMMAGLALSAAGDGALLFEARPLFLAGLGLFLTAHVAYAAAFALSSRPSLAVAAVLVVVGLVVVRWLWPRLGRMRVAVLAYCAAITAMLWLALGISFVLVPLGALLFYLSDLAVARQRFVVDDLRNRLVGLPLYYAAQYLLAWVVSGG